MKPCNCHARISTLEIQAGIYRGQIAANEAQLAMQARLLTAEQEAHQRTRGELEAIKAARRCEARSSEAPAFERMEAVL